MLATSNTSSSPPIRTRRGPSRRAISVCAGRASRATRSNARASCTPTPVDAVVASVEELEDTCRLHVDVATRDTTPRRDSTADLVEYDRTHRVEFVRHDDSDVFLGLEPHLELVTAFALDQNDGRDVTRRAWSQQAHH